MPIKFDENVPLDNKQLRIYNNKNEFTRVSVDEAIANGYNKWKGWKCSAGVRGLYIDYDGNIWIGNCASALINRTNLDQWEAFRKDYIKRVGKEYFYANNKAIVKEYYMSGQAFQKIIKFEDRYNYWGCCGNVKDKIDLPIKYVNCPLKACGCGADVILSKFKDDDNTLRVTLRGYDETNNLTGFTKILEGDQTAVEMNFPIPYQILWDLGRRCNYDCFYCWPGVHNNKESHLNYNIIIQVIDYMIDNWSNGQEIRWNFGGGEPTMHPRFLDILKHLKKRKQWTLVTTNGSRSTKFWNEARRYINTANMSAHFTSMSQFPGNEERFIENCKLIMEHHDVIDDDFWIEIKLMTPPGFLDRAIDFKQKIESFGLLDKPGANGRMKGTLSLVPIRSLEDSSKLVDYSSNELSYFKDQ